MSTKEQTNFLAKLFFIPIALLATLFMFSVLPWGDIGRMLVIRGTYASSVDPSNNPSYDNGSSATFPGVELYVGPTKSIQEKNLDSLRKFLTFSDSLEIIEKKTVGDTTRFKFWAKNILGMNEITFATVTDGKITDFHTLSDSMRETAAEQGIVDDRIAAKERADSAAREFNNKMQKQIDVYKRFSANLKRASDEQKESMRKLDNFINFR